MEKRKVLNAVSIGRGLFHYGYRGDFILMVGVFIFQWLLYSHTHNEEVVYVWGMSFDILILLEYYNIYVFLFNLLNGIKEYDRQEKIAEIIDFLPMNKKEKNTSNFLINYRKSIYILIPYIFMCIYSGNNDLGRGMIASNMIIITVSESIRNIFMKEGIMKIKRRIILICDIVPIISIVIIMILGMSNKGYFIFYNLGNLYVVVLLGIMAFAFMFYTLFKYKQVGRNV